MSKLAVGFVLVVAVLAGVRQSPVAAIQHGDVGSVRVTECGVVELVFDNSPTAYLRVPFERSYSGPPLVLVSECYDRGSWMIIKAEDVSAKECTICAVDHRNRPVTRRARVAYTVFAPEDIRHPSARILNVRQGGSKSMPQAKGSSRDVSKAELEAHLNERIGGRVVKIDMPGTTDAGALAVTWRIREHGSRELNGMGALDDVENMLEIIAKSGVQYRTVRLEGQYKSLPSAVLAQYKREAIARIDWNNLHFDVREFADSWRAHPDISP
jgi:hypothetical protein